MQKNKNKSKDFQFIFLRLPAAKAERAQQKRVPTSCPTDASVFTLPLTVNKC